MQPPQRAPRIRAPPRSNYRSPYPRTHSRPNQSPHHRGGRMSEWQRIETAIEDGTVVDLQFRDALGAYSLTGCVLHDGAWYVVAPPTAVTRPPVAWRPTPEPPDKEKP